MADVNMRILLSAVGGAGVMSALSGIASAASGPLVNSFTLAGAAAVIGLGTYAVKAASDFQSSLAKVQAYAGYTQAQTEQMGQSILQMAPQLGEAPKALADALYMVASAGFKGADSLQILRYAGMTAAASNSDATVVTKDLVASLSALGLGSQQAGNIMDELNATVKNGLLTWDSYGAVVGKLAGTVSTAGGGAKLMQTNFKDLNAALDVYTNGGITAHQASMWLNADMSLLDGKTATLAKNASKLGISFDENKFKSMSFAQQLQYLNAVTDGNHDKLVKLVGGNSTVANSIQYLNNHYKDLGSIIQSISGDMQNGQTTQEKFAVAQQTLAFKSQQAQAALQSVAISVGSLLLPVLSNILGVLTPLIGNFGTWISNASNAQPVLAGLAGFLLAVLIPAMWSLASAVIAATWPAVLIGVVIAGLVAIFQHFYTTNAPFRTFIDNLVKSFQQFASIIQANFLPTIQKVGSWLQANVLPVLQQIGSFLVSTFQPVWQNLVNLWNSQLLPLFKQLQPAFQQLLPLLQLIGIVIGTIVVVSIGVLVGLLTGLAKGVAGLLTGLSNAVGGIVQMFTGVVQVIGGIVQFINDLIHGRFSKLGSDLQGIWNGIVNIFKGAWQLIAGIFQAAWGLISGIVSGFVQGIIGFFQHLFDALVGHSIIPDMIAAIMAVFTTFSSWISAIWSGIVDIASTTWNTISTTITNIVNTLQNTLNNAWTTIKNGFSNAFNALAGIAQGAWNGVAGVVRSAINNVITLINTMINNVNGISGKLGVPAIPTIPYLASGVQNFKGGLAVVGEAGPELVQLPGGSNVIPLNGRAGAISANAGGGPTYVFYVSISTMARSQAEVSRLVDMLDQEISGRVLQQTAGYSSGGVF